MSGSIKKSGFFFSFALYFNNYESLVRRRKSRKHQKKVLTAAVEKGDYSCPYMAEQVPKIEQTVHAVKSSLPLDCSWWDSFMFTSFSSKLVSLSCKDVF